MSQRIVVLQHVAMEGPGRLVAAAQRAGVDLHVVRLDQGARVPDVPVQDTLIVMGGPMGVADVGNPKYPFLAAEVALMRARIAADAPTLGICLGAQLLAHAAGARVFPNTRIDASGEAKPVIELGWGPVAFHHVEQERCLSGMRETETMLHWHGDTFDLPPEAVHLASSPLCHNQACRLKTKLFGLQFHCEADADTVAVWIDEDSAYVHRALGPQGQQVVWQQTLALPEGHWLVGDRLLDNLLACLTA